MLFYPFLDTSSKAKKSPHIFRENFESIKSQLDSLITSHPPPEPLINIKLSVHKRRGRYSVSYNYLLITNKKLPMRELVKSFLITQYNFHVSDMLEVYEKCKKCVSLTKQFRTISKRLTFESFRECIEDLVPHYLTYEPVYGYYHLKLFEDIVLLSNAFKAIARSQIPFSLISNYLKIPPSESEIFIYFLIQNGNLLYFKNNYYPHFFSYNIPSRTFVKDRYIVNSSKNLEYIRQPLFWTREPTITLELVSFLGIRLFK